MQNQIPIRIKKELQILRRDNVQGIEVNQDPDNFRHFLVKIQGPPGTPYEKGIFDAEILLPSDYPMSPPKCLMTTVIYHPNFDQLGRICLDILKDKWTPALQLKSVLLSIQSLMASPNVDDFLDP